MSSIYKKGRDGYYYYQAYIYNPESKKKDKRVFHALSTKDLTEAEKKQQELDLKYEEQNYLDSNSSIPSHNLIPKPTMPIILGVIAVIILLFGFIDSNIVNQKSHDLIVLEKVDVIDKRNKSKPNIIEKLKVAENNAFVPKVENKPDSIKSLPIIKKNVSAVSIPKHTVERVDSLSGAFSLGKIYITLNDSSSYESQRLLCENISKDFSEFSNIVICLYSNNRTGKSLANGIDDIMSIEEQKRSWLAMYTYNVVEGGFFDDNPSRHLGNH